MFPTICPGEVPILVSQRHKRDRGGIRAPSGVGYPMSLARRLVHTIFERPEPTTRVLPIRRTSVGVWVPTPIQVIERACQLLGRVGLLGDAAPEGFVVDAGTGDGRVPAVMSDLDPTRMVCGIERDPALYARAAENLGMLHAKGLIGADRIRLIEGDYCDLETYAAAKLDLRAAHLFINYPDGNQVRLARFFKEQTESDARLCLLTHNRLLELEGLRLDGRHDVPAEDGSVWRLSIYKGD